MYINTPYNHRFVFIIAHLTGMIFSILMTQKRLFTGNTGMDGSEGVKI